LVTLKPENIDQLRRECVDLLTVDMLTSDNWVFAWQIAKDPTRKL